MESRRTASAEALPPAEDSPSSGLRERKKLETRSALRAAAVELYLDKGPSAVTVHDICEAAGVSPRTFFNYFETKDDAVFDWDHRLTHQLVKGVRDRPSDEPPLPALHRTIHDAVPALVADPGWHSRGALLRRYPELIPRLLHSNRRMEEAVACAVAERTGLPEDARYPRLLAGAGLAAFRTAMRAWDPGTGADSLLGLVDESFGLLAAGLPAPERDAAERDGEA
ncbi:TetR/AcrR family transcriptional regulator [Streptomyces sp. NPDC054796]